jgi:hypothetical protein
MVKRTNWPATFKLRWIGPICLHKCVRLRVVFRIERELNNVRGLIKNIRDRIYCRKRKHLQLPLFNACLVGLFGNDLHLPCHVVFSCISATSWNRFPFMVLEPGEEEEVAGGQIWWVRRVGNHGDAVLCQEFPDIQGRVAWRIVVVQNPGTGRSFVRPFPTNCISKA